MPLAKLLAKKRLTVVGLNSGTSADGLDLAAVRLEFNKGKIRTNFLGGKTVPYPARLSKEIQAVSGDSYHSIDEFIFLDRRLGEFFGEETARFCRGLARRKIYPDLVASHGQTVRHLPGRIYLSGKKESATVQLGHPETIAAKTGLTTVADFRQGDIGAGGEGAPITVAAMYHLFSDRTENRLLVNIGGISNYFYFPAGKAIENSEARDCGPGNSLLDLAAAKFFGRKYDRDGKTASRGRISMRLLTLLLADNYLKGKYGNSTGRERFGKKFLEKTIRLAVPLGLNKYDVMATLVELTAFVIARAVRKHVMEGPVGKIYLFGGGLKNRFLVERLKGNLFTAEIKSVSELKSNPDYLEAVCYAVMGGMAVREMRAGLPHITGGRKKSIAGRIILN